MVIVGDLVQLERSLPPRAASAAAARRLVSQALADSARADLEDSALLAVSELVTNALVHAGTDIGVHVSVDQRGVLVAVRDGNPHLPTVHRRARESGTGRGLRLVEGLADDWGIDQQVDGKVVWFRIGETDPDGHDDDARDGVDGQTVRVELRGFPLLIHAAWQEHSRTLLREYLLVSLTEGDEVAAFQRHADACEALNLLAEQAPALDLGADPRSLMSDAVEPRVTAEVFELDVPRDVLGSFDVLERMMSEAVDLADQGGMLVPGTQPEVREMRRWLGDQVLAQALTGAEPEPFAADLHHDVVSVPDVPTGWDDTEITMSDRALVAANGAGQVLAVSRSAAEVLGHAPEDLVGRRVLLLIPERFRQAHVAGMTLHAVNGRDPLLEHEVQVPMLRADGSEVELGLLVRPVHVGTGRVFVAELRLP